MENAPLFIIKSKGTAENYMNDNSDKHNHSFSWDIDYDGRQADVDFHMETDGDEKHMQFQLDNEDLAKILNYASEPQTQSIDERLLQDFPLSQSYPDFLMSPSNPSPFPLYNENPVPNPKIKIQIIPKQIPTSRPTSRSKKYYYHQSKPHFTRRKRLKSRKSHSRYPSTRRLLTPSQKTTRPKTMRIKLHEVK